MSIETIVLSISTGVITGLSIYLILNYTYNKKYTALYDMYSKRLEDNKKRIKGAIWGIGIEKLVPLLKGHTYNPHEMRFLGSPIDYVVFEHIDNPHASKINIKLIEIKSGAGKMSRRERLVADAVNDGRVSFEELRITNDNEVINEKNK